MIRAACLAVPCATPRMTQDYSPPDVPHGQKAPSGSYRLAPMHSVVARVLHPGFPDRVFRFDAPGSALEWSPDDPATSKLTAEVRIDRINTPAKGFVQTPLRKDDLDAAAYPTATFVSDSFTAEFDTAGKVAGQLAIMGQTHPATFDMDLVGAGRDHTGAAQGNPIIRPDRPAGTNRNRSASLRVEHLFHPIQRDAEFVRHE